LVFPMAMAQMPYNPTRILQNGTTLYVFRPSTDSSGQFELGSIDTSSEIAATKVPYTTLYSSLPFLDDDKKIAFTPLLDNGGNMTVYAGDCSKGASGGQLWSFEPARSEQNGNGSWRQEDLSFDQDGRHIPAIGANFLSGGVSFSAVVGDDAMGTGSYVFGGMCPSAQASNDWQSSANYSNLMVTLEPSAADSLKYQLSTSSSRGPPIAEAGFTLTGLSPSFSNRSDGTQTQQQNFVLVGGHTSTAFINMSQVALFSLPQQSWTFVGVEQPDSGNSDLRTRDQEVEVEPRSGHSMVLTPDGQHLIMFGGWIGDTKTAAEPTLAVLNIGEGYGGQGSWKWTVPQLSGTGLASNTGIYGHGAAMLPGGVMMVMGGYSIPSPNARRRRATQSSNSQTLFFNTTSNTWITNYVPPREITPSASQSNGPLSTTSQKAGLGVGLGVGLAAVLSLLIFYLWYTRRTKKHRQAREKQLQELAMSTHRYNLDCLSPGIDGRGGHADAVDYLDEPNDSYFYPSTGSRNQGWRSSNGHEAERTGLLVEIPSPTRGLRRSLGGRSGYHMSRYDERRVKASGDIHPIDELEEDQEHENTPLTVSNEMTERPKNTSIFDNAPVLDPFTDSSRGIGRSNQRFAPYSAPTSPARETPPENGHLLSDWQLAMGALLGRRPSPSGGRLSPDRSDRTRSDLSDRSLHSDLSSTSAGGSIGRSVSMRSTAMANKANQSNPFTTPNASPTSSKPNSNHEQGWESPTHPRTQSLTSVRSYVRPPIEDRESFATARTSFMQLQAEGEVLLGGNPDRGRPGTSSTSNASTSHTQPTADSTLSRTGTITAATSLADGLTRPRRKSWLGSVRRALSRSGTTANARTRSLTNSTPQLEIYTDDPVSAGAENTKRMTFPTAASPPRRAASDASFWRSRRGQQDWLDEELDPNDPQARWRRNSGDDWGAPEDVAHTERERRRREWRERGNLISLGDEELPTPRTPIRSDDLGSVADPHRPSTPADEDDWDVEAAVERRVVQVMFTVPKSKLRVVNADIDRSSLMSLPRENSDENIQKTESNSNSPGRVRDLAGRFEQLGSPNSPRLAPRPSPSPSIKSVKLRAQGSSPSLAPKHSSASLGAN
ncbi:hypothetical protein BU24DRAFT_326247, partial [Aaosphaeria arxii CBS 175.79]